MSCRISKSYLIPRPNLSDSGEDKQFCRGLIRLLSDILERYNCRRSVTIDFSIDDGVSRSQASCDNFDELFVNGRLYELISFYASGKTNGSKKLTIMVMFTRFCQPCSIVLESAGFTEATLKDVADEIAAYAAKPEADSAKNDKRKKRKRVKKSENNSDKFKTLDKVETVLEIVVAITAIITFFVSVIKFFGVA